MDGPRPDDAGALPGSSEPSVDELVRREIEAEEARQPRKPRPAGPRRRLWVLLLAALIGSGTGVVYFMEAARVADKMEILRFVSLYLTFPLALSVILLFAYFAYPER